MSINKRIKNTYIDTELVLPMYNVHLYFSLKNLGKKCALYMAKYEYYISWMDICNQIVNDPGMQGWFNIRSSIMQYTTLADEKSTTTSLNKEIQ